MTTLTARQVVYFLPSSKQVFEKWASKKAKSPSAASIDLRQVTGHGGVEYGFIEPQGVKVPNVILFFHGGGYNASLLPGHANWCFKMVSALQQRGIHTAAAVLQYGQTPEYQYPSQLRHARNALQHLLELGFRPENIIVGGDSAGGNLALALLSHLMHTHPDVEPVYLDGPLAGTFLVSPYLTDDISTPSYIENRNIDMLDPSLPPRGFEDYVPAAIRQKEKEARQGWACPTDADESWWSDLAAVTTNMYISAGQQELFRDHIIDFAQMVQREGQGMNTVMDVREGEAHDHVLLWEMIRAKRNPAIEVLVEWTAPLLSKERLSRL